MRTTVAIDDDVLLAVRERARREKRTAGQVLTDLARKALTGQVTPADDASVPRRNGFTPLPHRGPAVSNALIDALREDEAV